MKVQNQLVALKKTFLILWANSKSSLSIISLIYFKQEVTMNVSILHFSDIHIAGDKDSIFEKKELINDAIKNKILGKKYLFIVVTGDISNAGNESEYSSALDLLSYIKDELASYNSSLVVEFIIAPGNHDCNFTHDNALRDLSINSLNNGTLNIKDIKPGIIEACTSVQKNFFEFRELLENKKSINESISSEIFHRYEFTIGPNKISFNTYNLSWMSQRNEQQSKIFFPCYSFKAELIKETLNSDLNISVYHHPLHWLNHTNIKNLKELINISSNLVLSGHEHTSGEHQEFDNKSKTTQYIDSPALQTKNPNESSFKLLEINIQSGKEKIYDFSWDKDSGKYIESENDNSIEFDTCLNHFPMNEDYLTKLNNTGVQLAHSFKSNILLDDLFIYQDLLNLEEPELSVPYNASMFKDFENIKHVIVFGAETSGKTSLAQMLQMAHKQNGKVPILLSGKIIKNQDYSTERIQKAIERGFKKQYGTDNLNNFRQENKKNVFIIIDDFNEIGFNSKSRNKFIVNLNKIHDNIMILAGDSLELEAFNDDLFAESIADYSVYKIKIFGHKLRDKLIKQWTILGREDELDNEEIHNIVTEKARDITRTLGYNIVPSYPIYLLTLLQSMESNSGSNLSKSAYGHYYSFLITEALSRNNVDKKYYDMYYTYLSKLAYKCFMERNHSFSEEYFSDFHDEYRRIKRITFGYEDLKNKLLGSKILSSDYGNYKFSYDYLYYYFIAKYLSDNIEQAEIRSIIEKLVEKLYRNEFGNILMFLIHHSNTRYILNLLLNASKSVFSEIKEFGFEDDELQKINNVIDKEKCEEKLILRDKTPEEERECYLEEKEKHEEENPVVSDKLDADIDEDIGQLDLFAQLNLASKLTNILGEITKNYYGSLDGDIKEELLRETYSLSLRAINIFVKNFEEHHELIVKTIDELIEKKGYNTQEKIQMTSGRFIFNTLARLTEGFVSKLSKSIASKELKPIYNDILTHEPDNKAIKMINAAIELDFPNGLKDDAITHYAALEGNHLAQATLKKLVIDHMYMFHMNHSQKDRIMDKFSISKGDNKSILMKEDKIPNHRS